MNDERSTINHRIGNGPPMGAPDADDDVIAAFAGFEFDSRRDELRKDGVAISLRPKPRALLRHLLDHPGPAARKGRIDQGPLGGGSCR